MPIVGKGDQSKPVVASSRSDASFAVALNCGIGSSSLNALVNALERLHVVLGANSSICGLKYRSWTRRAKGLGTSNWPSTKACSLPGLDLLPHGLETPLHAVHSNRESVHEAK